MKDDAHTISHPTNKGDPFFAEAHQKLLEQGFSVFTDPFGSGGP